MSRNQVLASDLMSGFAERTGVVGDGPVTRYLWTDAFAVCNLLGLHRATGDGRWIELAHGLVTQVHRTLGRHRSDDQRSGWISGLDEEDGRRHPTAGGLRIGKELPERRPDEAADPRLEWDRDGQYFHYLTKWMHALARLAEVTGDPDPLRWARELAVAAHDGFVIQNETGRPVRMVWKMSIALDRPLVGSMGQHDPLDGLVTFRDLAETATAVSDAGPDLEPAIRDMAVLAAGVRLVTDDPLGLGGLLGDAWRAARLDPAGAGGPDLPGRLLAASLAGLRELERSDLLGRPPELRLPFRELGLAIGLRAVERLEQRLARSTGTPAANADVGAVVEALAAYRPLADRIEATWSAPDGQRAGTWTAHREINTVMLATSLLPEGYLGEP